MGGPGTMTVPATQPRTGPLPGPSGPGRIAALRPWSAFDRRFFRVAAVPAFLAVFVVTVVPLVVGLGLSFSSVTSTHNGVLPLTFGNYAHIWDDSEVHTVLINTVIYVVFAVGLETLLGLGLALLMTRKNRAISVFRVIFLLQLNWLASSTAAMPSVVLVDLWSGVPVVAVIVLAALLSAPKDPIEAALVDGAGVWARFRYVTFPAIRPALVLAALLRTVAAFQQFALFQILTGGGPGLNTTVLNFYVYQQTIVFNNIGYGAALAMLLLVVMAV